MQQGKRERGTRRSEQRVGASVLPYFDKATRVGIRIVDLLDRDTLGEKLRKNLEEKDLLLQKIYGAEPLDVEQIISDYVQFDDRIDPFITDTTIVHERSH